MKSNIRPVITEMAPAQEFEVQNEILDEFDKGKGYNEISASPV